jgi:hypothetical protein
MAEHISDNDLERCAMDAVKVEGELADLEEHLLWGQDCLDLVLRSITKRSHCSLTAGVLRRNPLTKDSFPLSRQIGLCFGLALAGPSWAAELAREG